MTIKIKPTDNEQFFSDDEIIVSKTDTHGSITYVNDVFLRVSGFKEDEVMGQPHSIIRHPEMPRAIFKLLWNQISSGKEIFAYVKNICRNGDYYWVFAHVTPSLGRDGQILGYHSSRRTPDRAALKTVKEIYSALLEEEKRHRDARMGLEESYRVLSSVLEKTKTPYEEYIWSIGQ